MGSACRPPPPRAQGYAPGHPHRHPRQRLTPPARHRHAPHPRRRLARRPDGAPPSGIAGGHRRTPLVRGAGPGRRLPPRRGRAFGGRPDQRRRGRCARFTPRSLRRARRLVGDHPWAPRDRPDAAARPSGRRKPRRPWMLEEDRPRRAPLDAGATAPRLRPWQSLRPRLGAGTRASASRSDPRYLPEHRQCPDRDLLLAERQAGDPPP